MSNLLKLIKKDIEGLIASKDERDVLINQLKEENVLIKSRINEMSLVKNKISHLVSFIESSEFTIVLFIRID